MFNENSAAQAQPAYTVEPDGHRFRILLASRNPDALEMLGDQLALFEGACVERRLISNGHADPLYGLEQLPDLLIMRLSDIWEAELEALSLHPADSRPPLLVVSNSSNMAVMRAAMKAGARDFFTEPVPTTDLHEACRALQHEFINCRPHRSASLTAVLNAKGGSGASLIATNLAHMIEVHSAGSALLLDLDLQFGSLSHYLDLEPKRGVKAALENIDELDQTALKAYLLRHHSGLQVMGSEPDRLMLTDEVAHEQLCRLLDLLAEGRDQLVVDLPRQLDLVTTTVLEQADNIVLVLQQGITHVRDAARMMEILRRELEVDKNRITVVINRFQKSAPIGIKEVARALDHERVVTVPNDFAHVSECLNRGEPLHEVARRAAITRAISQLSKQLVGESSVRRKGMLGGLMSIFRG